MIHYEFHTFSPIAQNRQIIFYLLFFAVRALKGVELRRHSYYVIVPYYFYIHTYIHTYSHTGQYALTVTASAQLAVLSGCRKVQPRLPSLLLYVSCGLQAIISMCALVDTQRLSDQQELNPCTMSGSICINFEPCSDMTNNVHRLDRCYALDK